MKVMKFGGTSVGSPERMKGVASLQARFRQEVRTSGKESTSLDDPGGI